MLSFICLFNQIIMFCAVICFLSLYQNEIDAVYSHEICPWVVKSDVRKTSISIGNDWSTFLNIFLASVI